MDIIRSIARWLCAVGLGLVIVAWITAATVNTTVLNRNTVKQWLAQSGIYNNNLGGLVHLQSTSGTASVVTDQTFNQALAATFTPEYIKQGSETALDGLYDWLDGKTQTVAFTVPVQQKADEFKANLANALASQLQNLPACMSRLGNTSSTPTCIPVGLTAQEYAQQLANGFNGSLLKEPLTAASFNQATAGAPNLNWLPQSAQTIRLSVLALPVLALVCAGIMILLSRDKLLGLLQVGRQMVISSVFLLAAGLVMWYVGSTVDLSANTDVASQDIAASIINPVAHSIIPGIGNSLSLFSGIVAVLGALTWLVSHIAMRKRQSVAFAAATVPAPQSQQSSSPALPQPRPAVADASPHIPSNPTQQKRPPTTRPKPPVI